MSSTSPRWVHLSPREGCILEETLQWKYGLPVERREIGSNYSQEIVVRNHGHYVLLDEEHDLREARKKAIETARDFSYIERTDALHKAIKARLEATSSIDDVLLSLLAEHLILYGFAKQQAEYQYLRGTLSALERRSIEAWRNMNDRWDVYDLAWERTAIKLGITIETLYFLTIDELRACLVDNPLPHDLLKRKAGVWSLIRNETGISLTLCDERPIKPPPTTELKATVAYRGGIVRGIVGKDIIVAPMATPDMTTEIKNARAVVTDAGGILCHAAILCREFHIPCVIGTNTGTHLFKEGCLIEVDTNTGIVRLID